MMSMRQVLKTQRERSPIDFYLGSARPGTKLEQLWNGGRNFGIFLIGCQGNCIDWFQIACFSALPMELARGSEDFSH